MQFAGASEASRQVLRGSLVTMLAAESVPAPSAVPGLDMGDIKIRVKNNKYNPYDRGRGRYAKPTRHEFRAFPPRSRPELPTRYNQASQSNIFVRRHYGGPHGKAGLADPRANLDGFFQSERFEDPSKARLIHPYMVDKIHKVIRFEGDDVLFHWKPHEARVEGNGAQFQGKVVSPNGLHRSRKDVIQPKRPEGK